MNNQSLLEIIIKQQIAQTGPMPYRDFLRMAHYYPKLGYYSGGISRISPRGAIIQDTGDFSTNPEKYSPIYGCGIALMLNQIAEANRGINGIFELGAGRGTLARDILDALRILNPSLYTSLTYQIVELSPVHVQNQRIILKNHLDKVDIIHGDAAKLTSPKMRGNYVVLSNEFFDDLPVTKTVVKNGKLMEVYVTTDKIQGLVETLGEVSDLSAIEYFDRMKSGGRQYIDGEVVMMHLEGVKLMGRINEALQKGLVITNDYGSFDSKPDPSERTYSRLVMLDSPYTHIGKQNITHDVDFWSLAQSQPDLRVEHIGPDLTTILRSSDFTRVNPLIDIRDLGELLVGSDRSIDRSFLMMVQSKGDFQIPECLKHTFDKVGEEYRKKSILTSYKLNPDRIINHLNSTGSVYRLTGLSVSREKGIAAIQVDSIPGTSTKISRVTFGLKYDGLNWKITGMGWDDGDYRMDISGDTCLVDITNKGEKAGKPVADLTIQGKEIMDRLKVDTPLGIALQRIPIPHDYFSVFLKRGDPANTLYVIKS